MTTQNTKAPKGYDYCTNSDLQGITHVLTLTGEICEASLRAIGYHPPATVSITFPGKIYSEVEVAVNRLACLGLVPLVELDENI